jgi:hypothetical protein
VPDEKLEVDPDRLDDSALVTVMLSASREGTEMIVRVELPASLPEDGVREWLSLGIRDGWRQTVNRLAGALASTSATV